MTTDEALAKYGLVPADEHLDDIRILLGEQADKERAGDEREDDLAYLCCAQLFSRGLLEDVLIIWEAKNAGMDLHCALDVQFMCGAGLAATKAFLRQQTSGESAEALEYIEDCEEEGDFEGFTPEGQLERYRAYFGIAGAGH